MKWLIASAALLLVAGSIVFGQTIRSRPARARVESVDTDQTLLADPVPSARQQLLERIKANIELMSEEESARPSKQQMPRFA